MQYELSHTQSQPPHVPSNEPEEVPDMHAPAHHPHPAVSAHSVHDVCVAHGSGGVPGSLPEPVPGSLPELAPHDDGSHVHDEPEHTPSFDP
jgi:hypothetical protein